MGIRNTFDFEHTEIRIAGLVPTMIEKPSDRYVSPGGY